MAAVDSLLRMISARNAEALSIIANGVPELRRAGAPDPLSMPPLSPAIVGNFLEEIGGPAVTSYCAGDGAHYDVSVEGTAEAIRITFVPAAAPPAPRHSDAPRSAAPRDSEAPGPSESRPHLASVPASRQPDLGALQALLEVADRLQASDLIISSGVDAWLRVGGAMQVLPRTALSEAQILRAFDIEKAALDGDGSMDFALETSRRYRVNLFRQCNGIAAAIRPIRNDPPSLESLHLPPSLADLAELRNGLVLVAGSAGSGKSTTLAALIEHLNSRHARHIITLEDPIEYRYQNHRCLIHQREVGAQVPDFPTGLRAALRESPDVLLVGEMRDRETIAAAITAAETGHLVLATIHASCATVAVDRMVDVFPDGQQRQIRYQLANILRATLTQQLVDSPVPPGRMPAVELMRTTSAIAAHIREDKTHQFASAIQTGRKAGMITLELSLANLVRSGRIRRATAEATARDSGLLAELLSAGAH